MARIKAISKFFKNDKLKSLNMISHVTFGIILGLTFSINSVSAQQIIPDGRTNTVLTSDNLKTNITTGSIKNGNAFNSFNRFNINEGDTVNFFIPNEANNLINLIHQEKSIINGTLNAFKNNQPGGNIYLVNPYGLTIGKKGIINVGSLTIVTPDFYFMNDLILPSGQINDSSISILLNKNTPLNQNASIEIDGQINAQKLVSIESPTIINTGQINIDSNDNIETEDIINVEKIDIASEQTIQNGSIHLSATKAIVNTGDIKANNINIEGEDVSIKGTTDAGGVSGGSINIDAKNLTLEGNMKAIGQEGSGGNINISATDVKLLSAHLNASGKTNGGTISIGGNLKKGNSDQINSTKTILINNLSSLNASSIGDNGDGGKIILFSLKNTDVSGVLTATPGLISGNGGLVEVSSKGCIDFKADVQTGLKNRYGNVILDPKDIIITAFGFADIENNDEYSENPSALTLLSNAAIVTLLETPQNVTLQANNDITLADSIIVNNPAGNGGNLTFQAGRSITIAGNIDTDNGNLNIYANDTLANGVVDAERDAGNAEIVLTPGFTINTGTGNVNIEIRNDNTKTNNESGNILLNSITANTVSINNDGPTADSNVVISAGTNINASGANNSIVISTTNGNFINSEGATALNAPNGRWLVYSNDPILTVINGLTYSKMYGSDITQDPPNTIPAGNYILYSISPVLTWTLSNATKSYGDPNPVLTPVLTGYIDGDTSSSITNTLQISSSTTTSSPVGTYSLQATDGVLQSALNYSFNIDGNIVNSLDLSSGGSYNLNNTLTILPVALSIQANDATKTEGEANPTFSSSFSGFVLGETASALTGILGYSTTATTLSPPGTYTITPQGLSSSNYTISFLNGILTVNPLEVNPNVNPAIEESIINAATYTPTANIPLEQAVEAVVDVEKSIALVTNESTNDIDTFTPDIDKLLAQYTDLDTTTANDTTVYGVDVNKIVTESTDWVSDAINDIEVNNIDLDTLIAESTDINQILEDSGVNNLDSIIAESTDVDQILEDSGVNNIDTLITESTDSIDETTQITEDSNNWQPDSFNDINTLKNEKPVLSTTYIPESILNIIKDSGDEPINVDNNKIMTAVFNLCQSNTSCNEIMTANNLAIHETAINLNTPKLELDADLFGTRYLSNSDYHPAGIKGYLITLNLIENIRKINNDNQQQQNSAYKVKNLKTSYIYRHPAPKIRINAIDNLIVKKHLASIGLNKVNKQSYRDFLNQPSDNLQLTPKVYEFLNKLHIITDEQLYFSNEGNNLN